MEVTSRRSGLSRDARSEGSDFRAYASDRDRLQQGRQEIRQDQTAGRQRSRVLVSLPARQGRSGSAARLGRRSRSARLDDQRVRVLHSYFSEMQSIGYWAPRRCRGRSREPVGRHEASGLRTTRYGRSPRSDAMKTIRFTSRGRAMLLAVAALLGAASTRIRRSDECVCHRTPSQWGTGSAFYLGHTVWLPPTSTFSMPAAAYTVQCNHPATSAHDWRTGTGQHNLWIRQEQR